MTIAILVQNLRTGGIQRLAVDEANELHRRAYAVSVITFEPDEPDNSMRGLLRIPEGNVIDIRYPRLRSIRGMRELVRILRRLQPDLLITHHWFANTVGRAASFFAPVPAILSFEHSVEDGRRPARQFFIDRLLQYRSRYVVAVSEAVRDSLVRHGIRPERIRVVANGTDLPPARDYAARPANRFAFVGRLVRDKGADLAVAALAEAPEATLEVIGDGPEKERLKKQAEKLGVSDRVEFAGYASYPETALKGAGCLIMPSRREGFGLAALEALSAGMPVIVSGTVAANGMVRDGVNGLSVPANDAAALADSMNRFIRDSALRERLAKAAPQELERYSIKAHVDALLSLV